MTPVSIPIPHFRRVRIMLTRTTPLITLLGLALLGPVPVRAAEDGPGADIQKQIEELAARERAVREKVNGAGAMFIPIEDPGLAAVFPMQQFYAVIFRQFPVGRVPPEPLKTQNLYLAGKDRTLHVTDGAALEKFFKAKLAPVKDEYTAKNAARAWLALSEQLKQDGFFRFAIPDEFLKWDPKDRQATGKAEVKQGGNGDITVTMSFDEDGNLARVSEEVKIRPGPRPICQATKLLDPDPIVRRMAEQDLLIMGSTAKDYLAEQRARARPDLQKAIDRLWERICREGR
jgi:hypothetical protein